MFPQFLFNRPLYLQYAFCALWQKPCTSSEEKEKIAERMNTFVTQKLLRDVFGAFKYSKSLELIFCQSMKGRSTSYKHRSYKRETKEKTQIREFFLTVILGISTFVWCFGKGYNFDVNLKASPSEKFLFCLLNNNNKNDYNDTITEVISICGFVEAVSAPNNLTKVFAAGSACTIQTLLHCFPALLLLTHFYEHMFYHLLKGNNFLWFGAAIQRK